MHRRDFFRAMGGAAGCSALSRAQSGGPLATGKPPWRSTFDPRSSIEHIVVVMMENRSFDHFLGWLPNSRGKQAGLIYDDPEGAAHSTYPLAPNYTGCPYRNPDHSYAGGRIEYANGTMDGFLLDPANDVFAIGYYQQNDLPFLSALALNYTTLDNYFCSILAPTYPNRIFLHAAQTDRLTNSSDLCTLPTIWDSLGRAGVEGVYYYSNLSFLGLWGTKYLEIVQPYENFLEAAAKGKLPAVAFVEPRFTLTENGDGNDFEPDSDVRAGDAFLASTFHAISQSPQWATTVFAVVFDEWGGFFDHVAPPRVIAPNETDPDLKDGKALLGFRVPAIVASPFTRGTPEDPRVSHRLYDHTSILKLIEWRWDLKPLTLRDGSTEIGNLALELNYWSPNYDVPALPLPDAPPVETCVSSA